MGEGGVHQLLNLNPCNHIQNQSRSATILKSKPLPHRITFTVCHSVIHTVPAELSYLGTRHRLETSILAPTFGTRPGSDRYLSTISVLMRRRIPPRTTLASGSG